MIPFSYDFMQPMYPLLIQQFLDDYNLSAGVALDIGTGPEIWRLSWQSNSNGPDFGGH